MNPTTDVSWMKRSVISPAGPARDGRDWAIFLGGCAYVLLVAAALSAIPAGVAWLLKGGWSSPFDVGMLSLAVICLWASFATVYWLKIDSTGLTFGRRAGGPKHLAWGDIHSITPAPRREVVLHGWLWPPLRPREATRCMSSLGHYRIEYEGGYCYFPPANEEEFLGALAYWRTLRPPPA
jgi:hypothetical protein